MKSISGSREVLEQVLNWNIDDPEKRALLRLAAARGIQLSYWDIWGNLHEIPLKTLKGMLSAMGQDSENPEEALLRLEEEDWTRLAKPVLVLSSGELSGELLFSLPSQEDRTWGEMARKLEVRLTVVEESGTTVSHSYSSDQLLLKAVREIKGTTYSRWSVPLPPGLGLGYYDFYLSVGLADKLFQQRITVILCPEQTYMPAELQGSGRRAGIAIALYALRSERNWGIGDFRDLKDFIGWAIECLKAEAIGLNPLHAIPNRQPYNISPYYPSSRFYRNFIYLDIESMEDYQASTEARKLVKSRGTQRLLAELRASPQVQYERVAACKLQVLALVFESFLKRHWGDRSRKSRRRKAFEAYIEKEGSLLDNYATFCALDAFFHESHPDIWVWQQWPEPYRDPGSPEAKQFRNTHWERILFHKYLQWQVEIQLREVQESTRSMGACIGLYHDLALGIDPGGADSWACGDFFVSGATVGAPPDDFALKGQDWGFHPPARERYRHDAYRLFVQEVRKNCQGGGALRIDHIMRFFRLFWILADEPAVNGAYVENLHEDLLKILALESHRNQALIIGEDLGTVPSEVRETLQGYHIFSYRLFYFERDKKGNFKEPESYPELALASVSTHDLPTLAGFWTARDLELRKKLGMFPGEQEFQAAQERRRGDKERIIRRLVLSGFLTEEKVSSPETYAEITGEVHHAIVGFLMSTSAKLVMLSQEDLFKEMQQQNVPGTVSEHPNWSTKMKYSLEDLRQSGKVGDYARMFRYWVARSGRASSTTAVG